MLQAIFKSKSPSSVIAYRRGKAIAWEEFSASVASLSAALNARPEQRWILFSEDAYLFAVAFFALLGCNKTIYMPHNAKAGTLADMSGHAQAFIGDADIETLDMPALSIEENFTTVKSELNFDAVDNCRIFICTSGSTGNPKIIPKVFGNLSAELITLQNTWDSQIENTVFLSTVSHQHIYGLLFRVLLPIAIDCPFDAVNYHYPEELIHKLTGYPKTVLISSPANLKALSLREESASAAGHVSAIFSSGGLLPSNISRNLQRMLKSPVIEVLGSSETGGVAHRVQSLESDSDSLWTPLKDVSLKLEESNQQLLVKSRHTFEENWVAMGDSAEIFPDGKFSLGARVDNVVKVEGKRLSLTEMDGRLRDIGLIQDAKTLMLEGRRHMIAAVIVLSDAGQQYMYRYNKNALVEYLNKELSHYFDSVVLPKKWRVVNELPVNEQSKVTRESLSSLFD